MVADSEAQIALVDSGHRWRCRDKRSGSARNASRWHVMRICHLSLTGPYREAADGAMRNKLTIFSAGRRAVEGGDQWSDGRPGRVSICQPRKPGPYLAGPCSRPLRRKERCLRKPNLDWCVQTTRQQRVSACLPSSTIVT